VNFAILETPNEDFILGILRYEENHIKMTLTYVGML